MKDMQEGYNARRSPHGERGLKLSSQLTNEAMRQSLSSRRAWIEMSARCRSMPVRSVALLTESVD